MCRYFVWFFVSSMMVVGATAGDGFVSPQKVNEWMKSGQAVLVDVREKDELKEGMAAGAQWFPFSGISRANPEWKKFVG